MMKKLKPHHTNEQRVHIFTHWKYRTDEQLCNELNLINSESVQKIRLSMGLYRSRVGVVDKNSIAFICEQFCAGVPINTIAKLVGSWPQRVSKAIENNWLTKKKSESTITIKLTSSI